MSGCIGVIMEGARREPGIWKQMVLDQFETDTIELARNV